VLTSKPAWFPISIGSWRIVFGRGGPEREKMGEERMWRLPKVVLVCGVLSLLLLAGAAERACAQEGWQPARRGHAPIAWVGAGVTNLVYVPVKVVYAGTGGLVAGLAYLITAGDETAFFGVWDPAAKGTYLVTPAMLEGKEPVRFIGS
jgi:hypothetical protein